MQSTTVWNSILVQRSLEKLRMGMSADLQCFYHQDIELKTANLLYQLTQEEIEEFHKCSEDIVYFVENYCRFMTDKGRKVVELRPYQKRILKVLAKENYIDLLDEFGPENRNLILLASRQIGKCLFSSHINIQYPSGQIYSIPIPLFYYMNKKNLSFLEKIKVKLLILYFKLELDKL